MKSQEVFHNICQISLKKKKKKEKHPLFGVKYRVFIHTTVTQPSQASQHNNCSFIFEFILKEVMGKIVVARKKRKKEKNLDRDNLRWAR